MLATLRLNALFTAIVIAASGFAINACSGPAFTNSDASGKGGADGDGGVTSSTGGTSSGKGGSNPSGGTAGVTAAGSGNGGASGEPAAGGASGGASSGGTLAGGGSSGGARTGGASSSGGARAGGAGGLLGLGGLAGGSLGVGGALGSRFPSTTVLDQFARGNGELGDSWLGATHEFALRSEQLVDLTDAGQPLVWSKSFGANQEAFATLQAFAVESREINLVLKAQEPGNPCDLIEVLYEPDRSQIGVDFCVNATDWTELPAFSIRLEQGDQLGARIAANGKLIVYRNGQALTTFDTSSFPYQTGGYIGVNALSIPEDPATWDNFGGGNATP